MERYESLGLVGEGSYGTVLKCRHRDSGRLVAIKKFTDSDDDKMVKKIALREIKLLRQLHHDNLVNLLEVWRRRRRWYLVFEFVERTLLDDLEQNPNGLDLNTSRQYLYQILRAAAFCHQQNIIHRDIKPENILISQGGVVKLCDFGFARIMTTSAEGGVYTDYVATRWYRAPELLVGDTKYGKPVDVWAVGCLLIEMFTGQPLFPGDSDLDQIYHIVRCFGNLTAHHQELFYRNPVFSGVRLPECFGRVPLEQRFPALTATALDLAENCLQMDPERRAQCSELLEHPLFTQDSFHIRVLEELNAKIQKDHRENSTLPKIAKTPRWEKDEGDGKNQKGKDMGGKVKNEKEKRDREGGEEKIQKTKGKQPSKPPKTLWNTSEPLMSTKQYKTLGAKIIDNAAKTTVTVRSKPGKANGSELKKEPEIPKQSKTLVSDSVEASKTTADLKDNKTTVEKPKHEKVASPEPRNRIRVREGHSKNTDTKDRNLTGLHSRCSDNVVSSVTEKSMMEIRRSPKPGSTQDFGKSWNNSNTKVHKWLKSSNSDHPNESPPPKSSLKSTIDPTDTNLTQKMGKSSTTEYPEGSATELPPKKLDSGQVETSLTVNVFQPSSNDHIVVPTSTTSSAGKMCKKTPISEHLKDCSNKDKVQRRAAECPNVTSLSISPSKTLISDLSAQSSTVFIEASPAHSTAILSRGTIQAGLSSDTKPTNDIHAPASKGLQTERRHTEGFIATKNQQDSCNTLNKDTKEDQGSLQMSLAPTTASNHIPISDASGGDYKKNPESCGPCSIHQQSPSNSMHTIESTTISSSMPREMPKTMSVGTAIPKTHGVSDKENREDFTHSRSMNAKSKSFVNQTSSMSRSSSIEQNNRSEPNIKSLNSPHCKSLIGGPDNHTKSTTTRTQKTRFSTETEKKRDNTEKNNTTNISTIADSASFTSKVTPDPKALTRSSAFHNMDAIDINPFDFSLPHSSPPPPPPPPSSTPLLLPPSSTPLVPSFSVVCANSQATSDHLTRGVGFHPGTHSLRCVDKPKHYGGIYSPLAQQSLSSHITGSLTAQVSEKSLICECSFLSDCGNHGKSDGITATKKKSEIHFPDVRRPGLAELRGREGKHNKSTSKDQRKNKQTVPSISSSEPQQH